MAHEHTGWGFDRTFDCEGCEDEIHDRMASNLQRSMENNHITEWLRENAPKFVEKFLAGTYPEASTGGDIPS